MLLPRLLSSCSLSFFLSLSLSLSLSLFVSLPRAYVVAKMSLSRPGTALRSNVARDVIFEARIFILLPLPRETRTCPDRKEVLGGAQLIRLESFRWEARGIHRVSMKISLVFFSFFTHRAREEEEEEEEEWEEMASENQTR